MNTRIGISVFLVTALAVSGWGETCRFAVTGDSRGGGTGVNEVNTNVLHDIAVAMADDNVDIVVFTGDLIQGYPATEAAFRLWTNAMGPVYDAGIPVYPMRGNHDQGSGWDEVFGGDIPTNGPEGAVGYTFWVTNKECLFICLDQYILPHRVNQPWLDGVLASNKLLNVFAFGHEPAFKVHHTDCLDDYPSARDTFWHSLERAGCKAYACGHDHFIDIARLDDGDGDDANDLHQYIAATAGAPLYTIGPYDGLNGMWTPVKVFDQVDYGYVLGETDGQHLTLTWRHRVAPGAFASDHVDTFNVLDQFRARYADPADGSTNVPSDVHLSWTAPYVTVSNRVYLGTNASAVAGATVGSPEYRGASESSSFDLGVLTNHVTYFWRIDEVLSAGSVATGSLWSFSLVPATPLIANASAADVAARSASLTGNLLSTGGAPTRVYAFWGTTDGGAVRGDWTHTNDVGVLPSGPFTTGITNLTPKTRYYYRCYATNSYGDTWASTSATFVTGADVNGWGYRRRITPNGYGASEVLEGFPLLVILSAASGVDYGQFASPDGADLLFTDSDGESTLSHEIESWDTNGESVVWVRVPEMTSNTFVWAYWGNPAATNPPVYTTNGATWANGYGGVWHLNEQTGVHIDASAHGNDGVPQNGVDQNRNGTIDGADGFDGVDDFIAIANSASLQMTTAITVSAWIRSQAWTGEHVLVRKDNDYRLYDRDLGNGGPYAMTLKLKGLSVEEANFGIEHYSTGHWYYVAGTYDVNQSGDNLRLYTDGSLVAATNSSGSISVTTDDVFIGSKLGTGYYFDGRLDEVRISHICRSPDWIQACWLNQMPGSDFVTLGPVIEVDTDADGLPDWWERQYFGHLEASSGSSTNDWDGDFSPDCDEYVAGTDPTDPESVLTVSDVRRSPELGHILEWPSVAGHAYDIEHASNGLDFWNALVTNLPATTPQNVYTVAPGTATLEFYRIHVQ